MHRLTGEWEAAGTGTTVAVLCFGWEMISIGLRTETLSPHLGVLFGDLEDTQPIWRMGCCAGGT